MKSLLHHCCIFIALSVFGLFCVAACSSRADTPSSNSHEKARGQMEESSKVKGVAPKNLVRGGILVGGCYSACHDPVSSLTAFLDLMARSAPRSQWLEFVDSSELVYLGQDKGTEWRELFLASQLEERRASILSWAGELENALDRQRDQKGQFSFDAGSMNTLGPEDVEFRVNWPLVHSAVLNGCSRLTLGLRGLEWLVRDISPCEGLD